MFSERRDPLVHESERRHVFHLAGKRISIEDSEWGEERNNQLVFIGKN